jgi:5-methylthioadenosine/S-adenosylhomocysteine deaminase
MSSVSEAPPPRRELLIRGAYVMTMSPRTADIPVGDVHVRSGQIVAVARSLDAPGAQIIDGRGKIVMPGLVDTHTHLWQSAMRGRFGSTTEQTYFKVRNALADGFLPGDMYQGTLLGATEAVSAGITTAVDFCHNNRGSEYVTACLQALRTSGIRCRFLFGASTRSLATRAVDLHSLEELSGAWSEAVEDAPLTLGFAWRGPLGITALGAEQPKLTDTAVAREEFVTARKLGLPIAIHVSGTAAKQVFDSLCEQDFLGPDVQLVHFSNATMSDIRRAAESGASVALTPVTELRVGYGITQLSDYLEGGMRVGLGIDSSALAGNANLFQVMKLLQLIECGRLQRETALPARRLLELATLEGARSIGMEGAIGSLEPGKRADLIMLSTDALNMGRFTSDPVHLLVEAAQPVNVDTVIIDGRVLKSAGRMMAVDQERVMRSAEDSIKGVLVRTAQRH